MCARLHGAVKRRKKEIPCSLRESDHTDTARGGV